MKTDLVVIEADKFHQCAQVVDRGLMRFNEFTDNISALTQTVAELKRDIAVMDHQLDLFIVASKTDLEKFKLLVPLAERQLDKISSRMDNITMKILMDDFSSIDVGSVKKREMLIDMLSQQSENFNSMIMKLLSK